MLPIVAEIHDLLLSMTPHDDLERSHLVQVLAWLDATDDVFRRAKPGEPDPHLVAYVVLVDSTRRRLLLLDHIKADLWLPPGGHVEPGEHPAAAAARELGEELGIAGVFTEPPLFLTVTQTNDPEPVRHTDVSIWFTTETDAATPITLDAGEARSARWWGFDELMDAPGRGFDPHQHRFMRKLLARS